MRRFFGNLIVAIFALMFLVACEKNRPLPTVARVDLSRYMGTWYEIARLPNRFQRDCQCTKANYHLHKQFVTVVNSCYRSNSGKLVMAKGKAWVVKNSNNSKLKVRFLWPFRGDYWIIALDKHYQYAMVGTPNRKYLWILSRKPTMDMDVYNALLSQAERQGFKIKRLLITKHQHCH